MDRRCSACAAGVLMLGVASHCNAEEPRDPLFDLRQSPTIYAKTTSPAEESQNSGFRFTLDGAWLWGPANGQLQTPSGGEPGSTSKERPTLEELGIETASVFDVSATAGWGPHELYIGGQWICLSGSATLDQTLISQGMTFPAGTSVDSSVQFDWYRFGYRYRIELGDG